MKKSCYAVKRGRKNDVIVHTWYECEELIKGFKGAVYKGFGSYVEAKSWLSKGLPDWAKPEKKEIMQRTAVFIPATNKKNKYGYYKPRYFSEKGVLMADYGTTIGCDYDPDNSYQGEDAPW